MTSAFEDWAHFYSTILAKCEDNHKFQPNALAVYPHESPLEGWGDCHGTSNDWMVRSAQ